MKIRLLFCLMVCFSGGMKGQIVTFTGQGNLPIPPGAPGQTIGVTQSLCNVTGVGIIGNCVTIENVTIDLQHTFVGDIGILLIGPGGQVLELSTGNGGSGDNYSNTVFSDNAGDFITTGTPPYTGNFRPEGRVTNLNNPYNNAPPLGTFTFANTYNGTNGDGNWTLYINDYVALDIGTLLSWSITFNLNGAPPVANAGQDVSVCSGATANLNATGGGTYAWSNGATTANTSVNPSTTTTYTVTVTTPGCGSDTDEVIVNITPKPTVTLDIGNENICVGACPTLTAVFTGTPPFTLTVAVIVGGNTLILSTQSFASLSGTFTICVPGNVPPGPVLIQSTSLTDAFCICN
jgi:subtilisin-like proprotein convertase family protein